ncbi:MAG: hypothetical protein KF697_05600 [Pseudolabrys sp.]|nr:hypothetical protein [Pseudolabrys sp.]
MKIATMGSKDESMDELYRPKDAAQFAIHAMPFRCCRSLRRTDAAKAKAPFALSRPSRLTALLAQNSLPPGVLTRSFSPFLLADTFLFCSAARLFKR